MIQFRDSFFNQKEEKILLLHIIGVLEAIIRKNLSLNEAEKFLFSPYIICKLKKKKCNNKIITILEEGCELEDIASLLPESLEKNIIALKEQTLKTIEEYPKFEDEFWL